MRRLRLYAKHIVLLSGFWVASWSHVSAQGAQQPSPQQSPGVAENAGSQACVNCHADVIKKFGSNPHTRLTLMHGGKGVTCEECHGSVKAHIESGGDATKIFSFKKATASEVAEKCEGCHAGSHPKFDRSAHGSAGISCVNCHSVHSAEVEESLLKTTQTKLCTTCHTDVMPEFSLAFHHKVNEGLINCSDCHEPHGVLEKKNLKSAADQNQACIKCHMETAGPFVYEHPPVKIEGCASCHSPHGSQNQHMLVRSNVNLLCTQCHTTATNFKAPGTPSYHNQANQNDPCTSCHTQVHGSNASNIFAK